MDNHPIPQDVTHFQFKLIGNLTLKQFGYVATGGIAAWIIMSSGIPLLIKILISLILAGSGLIFAFVPIEGRAADLMLTYFFKALFQPNQYLFKKQDGVNALFFAQTTMTNTVPVQPVISPPLGSQQRNVMPSGMPMLPVMQQAPQTNVQKPGQQQPSISPLQAAPSTPKQLIPPPVLQVDKDRTRIGEQPQTITQPIPTIQPMSIVQPPVQPQITPTLVTSPLDIAPIKQTPRMPMPEPTPVVPPVITPPASVPTPQPIIQQPQQNPALQAELQNTLAQKKQLEEQLEQLKKQLEQKAQMPEQIPLPVAATPAPRIPTAVSSVVKTVSVPQKTSQAPMVSDFPNIIMGVVKDARGNVLPNILIEVKDNDDNPVRAFKTNPLGQFASATPLLNGTYTILFEDPAKTHNFDALQIEVSGEIMQPVEVISHDQREDLRKELFG